MEPLTAKQRALVSENIGLADVAARKWLKTNRPLSYLFEDMKQAAYLGLIRAAQKWSPTGGASFRTYSYLWIDQYIRTFIARNKSLVPDGRPMAGQQSIPKRLDSPLPVRWPGERIEPEFDTGPVLRSLAKALERFGGSNKNRERHVQMWVERATAADGSLAELGRRHGFSRERARQICSRIDRIVESWSAHVRAELECA